MVHHTLLEWFISGHVYLHNEEPVRATSLKLHFKGQELVQAPVTQVYYRYLPYNIFHVATALWGSLNEDLPKDEWDFISPGEHIFPFAIRLPYVNFPPSFDQEWGWCKIRYTLHAVLVRPGQTRMHKSQLTEVKFMPFIPTHAMDPPLVVTNRLRDRSDTLIKAAAVLAKRTKFVPGEEIPIILRISPESTVPVHKVTLRLVRASMIKYCGEEKEMDIVVHEKTVDLPLPNSSLPITSSISSSSQLFGNILPFTRRRPSTNPLTSSLSDVSILSRNENPDHPSSGQSPTTSESIAQPDPTHIYTHQLTIRLPRDPLELPPSLPFCKNLWLSYSLHVVLRSPGTRIFSNDLKLIIPLTIGTLAPGVPEIGGIVRHYRQCWDRPLFMDIGHQLWTGIEGTQTIIRDVVGSPGYISEDERILLEANRNAHDTSRPLDPQERACRVRTVDLPPDYGRVFSKEGVVMAIIDPSERGFL
ncbi:hypothetical protein BC937DRAFT_90762 [Endogone sp. FLAS-F59071]|nr:hypothetical protein BC937DRAFT_90762 [Endogone sp. FLAS-F59071]|eukprot:RUS16823.1 hypothetical protein BC937DRAFT_90762 [Endogone sp. FLAS-F59071]